MNTRFAFAGIVILTLGLNYGFAASTWSSAVDGTWDDVAKWSDGVPNNEAANLTPTGADYTVTVTAVPAGPYTDLTVQNAGTDTTTLNVNTNGFKSNDGLITIGQGATLKVNTNGVMTYDGSDSTKTIVEIKDGGIWHLDGGSVIFTNLYPGINTEKRNKIISIGGVNSEGTLRISAGLFVYKHPEIAANYVSRLQIGGTTGSKGLLEMTGGSLHTASSKRFAHGYELYVGTGSKAFGQLMLSNDASMLVSNTYYFGGSRVTTGTGEVVVANSATMTIDSGTGRNVIGAGPNSVGTLTVKDNAKFEVITSGHNTLGGDRNNQEGGTGIINVMDNATVSFNNGTLNLGTATRGTTAYGEVNLSGGRLTVGQMTSIGHGHEAGSTGIGVMNVSGGALTINSNNGLVVGYSQTAGAVGIGTLNLSGGVVSNSTGYTYISFTPDTTGVVHQVAGDFIIDDTSTYRSMYVGYGGGDGKYGISGGGFSSRAPVFVGGATGDGGSSHGLMEITGGSFSVTNTLFVGQNGTGKVSISGGELSVSDLNLESGDATLGFDFSSGTIGSCNVSGTLTIDPAAKLEIDPNGAIGNVKYTLVSCGTRSGSFDSSNITVIGGDSAWVDQDTDNNIYFKIPTGTVIMIR